MNKGKILVLGGASYIGRYLVARLGPERVVATYNAAPLPGGVKFDALTMRLEEAGLDLRDFSHAVILINNTKPDSCANNPKESYALNVTAICSIIDQLAERGVFPIFTSSEAVFDGGKGGYAESDPVNPVLAYGRHKVEVENYLTEHVADHLIVRIAHVYDTVPDEKSLIASWLRDVACDGETVRCAHDYISSVVHMDDVTEAMIHLIEGGCRGVYHLAGPQALSRLEIFETLLDEIRKVRPVEVNVVSCSINDFPTVEGRPLNISMKADKLIAETGLIPRDLRLACRHLVNAAGQATA